jgi:hypothetical protein
MQKTAWLAANLMNIHLKKKVTVNQLLGKSKTMAQEDKVAKFEELKNRMRNQKKAE